MMMQTNVKKLFYIGFLSFFIVAPLHSITLVYNLRIAETTRLQLKQLLKKRQLRHSIIALTPFAQFRKLLKEVHQSAYGSLATYIYLKERFFARINAAIGHVHTSSASTPVTFSRTQTDDILGTVGYAFPIHDCLSVGTSFHLGIPTHEDTSLQALQFGTGHFGLGMQVDTAYQINEKQAFMAAARFIHFFPRDVKIELNTLEQKFDFNLGNVGDLLFVYQYGWQRHQIEVGYNPTIIFDAHTRPPLPLVMEQINSTIHNFFGSYRCGFLIKNEYPSAIIIGTSVGIVPRPERFGNTQIATIWFSWGMNF